MRQHKNMGKKAFLITSLSLILLVLTNPVFAQETTYTVGQATGKVTSFTQVFHSGVLNEARVINIYPPFGYQESTERYPVMIVLDGDGYAAFVAETAKLMSIQGFMPPVLVIGIGNTDRTRDLSPFARHNAPNSGGGKKFIKFMRDELLAYVDQEYRSNGYHILFGHSLGGLLGVYSIFNHPEVFQACIAASPALGFDGGATLQSVVETLKNDRPDRESFLYLTIANEPSYDDNLNKLTDLLNEQAPEQLRWLATSYPEKDHSAIVFQAVIDGLPALYNEWPLMQQTVDQGFDAVAAHFSRLSERYGYKILIPEYITNQFGYLALGEKQFDRAIQRFKLNVENFPDSFNALDSLGEGYLKKGDFKNARVYYHKSLELNPRNLNASEILKKIGDK